MIVRRFMISSRWLLESGCVSQPNLADESSMADRKRLARYRAMEGGLARSLLRLLHPSPPNLTRRKYFAVTLVRWPSTIPRSYVRHFTGLSGEELEAALLAYRIANNWPLDNAAEDEERRRE